MTRLYFRNPRLVTEILHYLDDKEEPISWDHLVVKFTTSKRSWKTVENRLYDLVTFGAIHRMGQHRRTNLKRTVKLTPLGRAWLEHRPLAPPAALRFDLWPMSDEDLADQDDDDF